MSHMIHFWKLWWDGLGKMIGGMIGHMIEQMGGCCWPWIANQRNCGMDGEKMESNGGNLDAETA